MIQYKEPSKNVSFFRIDHRSIRFKWKLMLAQNSGKNLKIPILMGTVFELRRWGKGTKTPLIDCRSFLSLFRHVEHTDVHVFLRLLKSIFDVRKSSNRLVILIFCNFFTENDYF